MNQRNVEALRSLYYEWDELGDLPLPEFLTSRGVLAPSTLTHDGFDALARLTHDSDGAINWDRRAEFTNALERIAKGEQ